MKRYTKLIITIGVILFIAMGATFYIVNKDNNITQDKIDYLDKVVTYVLKDEIENFDQDKIDLIKHKVEQISKKSKDKAKLSQVHFVLGNIYAVEKENKKAIIELNKSVDNFDKLSNTEIKVKTYYELSKMYLYEEEYSKSEAIYKKVKALSQKDDKRELIIKYNLDRAHDLYYVEDSKKKTIELLEEALKIAEEIDYDNIEDIYFELGRAYWSDDRSIEGVNTKLEALSISQSKNLKVKISKISIDIGIDYLYSQNYNEAIVYLSRVLYYNLDDKIEDAEIKAYALINLCDAYTKVGQYDDAKDSFKLLEKNIKKLNNSSIKEDFKTCMYVAKADLETKLENPKQALIYLDLAKSRYKKSTDFNFYDLDERLIQGYGDAYYKLGDYKKALAYHKDGEALVKKRKISYLEEDYNQKLYLDYKALEDNKNTIKYLEKNNELKTIQSNDIDRQYSHYLISKFENEKKVDEISKLQKYKETMRLILIILCLVTGIIMVFTYTIYKKNKEINRLNKLFKSLSITDSLTKIQNRRALDEYLAGNLALYKETQMPISFMMIDIDFFKKYNDNYGHPEGDKVLEKVASSIKKSSRNSDFVARYGGEEFIVIMLNTDEKEGINLVNRIIKNIYNLNIEHKYSEVSDRISLSIGLTTSYIGNHNDCDDYIKKADNALYEAKQSGRNKYVYLP
ncbi:MAG: tetratricopeptide repeat-containing diguanylate cyclase [Terrisporobacter sp.]|uniref:tetratricopeptide repeat-containing diguanylate cyclase n=1 Tax=Terrisporobacter sp. TaxID=1965305 RepID=UPI002FC77297